MNGRDFGRPDPTIRRVWRTPADESDGALTRSPPGRDSAWQYRSAGVNQIVVRLRDVEAEVRCETLSGEGVVL